MGHSLTRINDQRMTIKPSTVAKRSRDIDGREVGADYLVLVRESTVAPQKISMKI